MGTQPWEEAARDRPAGAFAAATSLPAGSACLDKTEREWPVQSEPVPDAGRKDAVADCAGWQTALGPRPSPPPSPSLPIQQGCGEAGEAIWAKLDGTTLATDSIGPSDSGGAISQIEIAEVGGERVSVRVVESGGGLEVRVAAGDLLVKQHLLGSLAELTARVRELSLDAIVETASNSNTESDRSGGRRQPSPFEWEEWRLKPRRGRTAQDSLQAQG